MFNYFAQTKENKANFLEAQVPNKRIGTPEEIANAIVFIGSDKAAYIIGVAHRVARAKYGSAGVDETTR
jgi:NAD(P)-dependent dehydrogenase (short-subunit alcohol dehydrogenase family)